jgi:hypothetical protein
MASPRLLNRAAQHLIPRGSRALSAGDPEPIKTALYDLHLSLNGKMVPFGKCRLVTIMVQF